MGLAPPHFGELKPKARPDIGKELPVRSGPAFLDDPGSRRRIEILPELLGLIPDETPGVRITLPDHIFSSRGFVNGITNRVTSGNIELAQQQHRGAGEVFAMAFSVGKEEPRKSGLVRVAPGLLLLPRAISKVRSKERLQSGNRLRVLLLQMQIGENLPKPFYFARRNVNIVFGIRGRINRLAWT